MRPGSLHALRCLAYVVAISGWPGPWQIAAATGYAGAKICGGCHPAEFASQSSSAHANALFRAPDHPLAAAFAAGAKLTRKPRYRFEFFRPGGELRTRISDGTDVMDLPMEWAFGAGQQAVTFVTKIDKDWYVEHYSTYYSVPRSWGATPGQEIPPASLPEAAGRVYSTSDPATGIAGCFECHSTGPVSFGAAGEARITEPGVRCESCHGQGAEHAANPSRKNIRNPENLSARELNRFCGTCHRQPAPPGQTVDWKASWNVRHQPMYLNESACFRKSGGALTCLTCHDPHEPAGKKASTFYNSRCVDCHSTTAPPPKPACETQTPANCIDCHMPLVSPQAPLRFTNHWIGVYAGGAKLKPVR
jgi:hypothetical protein